MGGRGRAGRKEKHRGEGKSSRRKIKAARGGWTTKKEHLARARGSTGKISARARLGSAQTGDFLQCFLIIYLFIFRFVAAAAAAAVASQLPCGANEGSMCGMSMSRTGECMRICLNTLYACIWVYVWVKEVPVP